MRGGWWLGVLALVVVACGGDDGDSSGCKTGPQCAGGSASSSAGGSGGATGGAGGASGATGGAGSSGGAGGSGGGAGMLSADDEVEACIVYRTAICERRRECGNYEPDMPCPRPSEIAECPFTTFPVGSSRTIESVVQCAEDWRTYDCAKVLALDFLPCDLLGTRAIDETCIYGHQCASGACFEGSETCGRCRPVWQPGDDCNNDDVVCPGYTLCSLGECVEREYGATVGYRCERPFDCSSLAGSTCPDPGGGATESTCALPPAAGAPCMQELDGTCDTPPCYACAEGAYCNDAVSCVAYPGAGQACGIDRDGDPFCAAGTYCAPDLFCRARPAAGEPCAQTEDDSPSCDDASFCKASLDPPMCEVLPSVTAPCANVLRERWGLIEGGAGTSSTACAEGFGCFCDDYAISCGYGPTCRTIRLLGESCTAEGDLCELSTHCSAGECVLDEAVDRFEQLCGG